MSERMTREERLDWLCRLRADLNNGIIFTPWNKEFTEALTVILEQEPCEDAISRQAAIDTLEKHQYSLEYCKEHGIDYSVDIGMARIALNELPSVTPVQSENTMIDAAIDEWRGEMDNAIKRALEKQIEILILDKIRAEIEETYMNITYEENHKVGGSWGLRKALEIINKYKADKEDKK